MTAVDFLPAPSVALVDNRPATTSLDIADHFGKQHKDVLKSIRNLCTELPEEVRRRNFALTFRTVAGPNNSERQEEFFTVYFDGFILLVMGYTGKKALGMKLAYIAAFNAMREKLEGKSPAPAPEPSPISKRTDPERKQLTAIINTWVGMAPIHYANARAQVNAHFGVASVDKLTVSQVKDAIQWVQDKIDALPPAPKQLALPTPKKGKFEAYIEQVETFRARTESEISRLLKEGLRLVDVYKFGPEGITGFSHIFLTWLHEVAVSPSPLVAHYWSMDRAIEHSPLYIIREMEKILPTRLRR